MFFEDEKENLDSLDNLDDLELDLDDEADDESINWEELLKDDSVQDSANSSVVSSEAEPLKIRSIKEEVKSESEDANTPQEEEDFEFPDLDDEEELSETLEEEPKKDAFEVFGGNAEDDITSDDLTVVDDDILDDDNQSVLNELDNMESTDALDEESEDSVSLPNYAADASKPKLDIPVIAGVLLAVFLVVGSIAFIFAGPKTDKNQNIVTQQNPVEEAQQAPSSEENTEVNLPSQEQEQIPVLDDKNAKKLKPEKKVVLSVESAGRLNPFMPTFDEFNGKYYAGVPAQVLMPPDAYGNEPDAQDLMKVAVSGILFDNVKPSAIITINDVDYFVQKGDKVDDYMVLDINRQSVVVKKGTNIYKAGVGERFNQNVKIDGSAVYGSGGAMYYSSASPSYTSASDVEVRTQD